MLALKKFRHSPSQSRETVAFTAELTWHRVTIGHARNDGSGGATLVHLDPVGLAGRPREQIIAAAEKIVRKGPLAAYCPTPFPTDLQSALEELADTFVELELANREQKRLDKVELKHAKKHLEAGRPWTICYTTDEGDRRILATAKQERVSIILENESQSVAGITDGTVRVYHNGVRLDPAALDPTDFLHN